MDVVSSPEPDFADPLSIIGTNDVTVSPAPEGCSVVVATGPNPSLVLATPHSGGSLVIAGAPDAQLGTSVVNGSQVAAGPTVTLDAGGRSVLNSELRDGHLILAPAAGTRTVTCHPG